MRINITSLKSVRLALSTAALSFALLNMIFLTSPAQAAPSTFTVINTNDSGFGSLRQAILSANANGNPSDQDVIDFNIPGDGDQQIEPQSQLLITESVLIDGYTQSDSQPNTNLSPEPLNYNLRIEIFNTVSDGIKITGEDVTIRGVAINGGATNDLILEGANNFSLEGSNIGTDTTGLLNRLYENGTPSALIEIYGSDNVNIGGGEAEKRNVIGPTQDVFTPKILADSLGADNTSDLTIKGNNIGVGSDGISSGLGVGSGVAILLRSGSDNVTIGGELQGEGNSIMNNSGGAIIALDTDNLVVKGNLVLNNGGAIYDNTFDNSTILLGGVEDAEIGSTSQFGGNIIAGSLAFGGIKISSSQGSSVESENITIKGNKFGVGYDGSTPFSLSRSNITVADSTNQVLIQSNLIVNSSDSSGVEVLNDAQNVSILQNSIYDNTGLGIDLNGDGVTVNDDLDVDSGPNSNLNFPYYTDYQEAGGDTEVSYATDLPAGDYRIEFYSNDTADPSGNGEGQEYLGYTTITSSGSLASHSYTLSGITGVTNLALTATEIDVGSPTGFGATSEFGALDTTPPNYSLNIAKTLLNPEGYAQDGQVQFTVTIENDGEETIDLTNFDGTYIDPLAGSLFTDFLPSYMTIVGVDSGEASCFTGGTLGTLAAPLFANHLDYYAVFCAYTGSDTTFEPGDSIDITYTVDIASDALLNDINYAIPGALTGDPGVVVSQDCFTLVGLGNGGDQDFINCMASDNSADADFAQSGAPTDVEVSKSIDAPNGIVAGENISYELTFTNNGPGDVDLAWYSPSTNNSLFADIFPSSDLTISGFLSTDGIDCTDLGPGSTAFLGAFAEDHSDHTLVICYYTNGDSKLLASGESISVTIEATVNNGASSDPVNYLLHFGTSSDEDSAMMSGAIFSATEDNLDEPNMPGGSNFFRLAYLDAEEPGEPGDGGNTGGAGTGANNGAQNGSGLTNTGDNSIMILVVGAILTCASATLLMIRKRGKNEESK